MNREILFRGKRADNGDWIEGYCYRISDKLKPFIMLPNRHGESYEVITETVGQYTGLTDKNGNRIFEGDIVEFDNDKIGYVVYDEHETEYGIVYDENVYCGLGRDYIDKALEVVGNIHDSELLEKN